MRDSKTFFGMAEYSNEKTNKPQGSENLIILDFHADMSYIRGSNGVFP